METKKGLYSDIIIKLKELESMNEIEPVFTFGSKDTNSLDNIMKRQKNLMDELKTLARANNTLLGRTVRFQMADSYALYVVTKVNKNSVRLTWVKYCDGWQDGRIGYESNIDINYVTQEVKREDALARMFAEKKSA